MTSKVLELSSLFFSFLDSLFFHDDDFTCAEGEDIFFGKIHRRYLLAKNSCSGTISFSTLDQKYSRKQCDQSERGHDGTPS